MGDDLLARTEAPVGADPALLVPVGVEQRARRTITNPAEDGRDAADDLEEPATQISPQVSTARIG